MASRKRKRGEDESGSRALDPRKTTAACSECRKQKIKCDLPGQEPPCIRCERRGLNCVLHCPTRATDRDQRNYELVQKDLLNLHAALSRVSQQLHLDPLADLHVVAGETSDELGGSLNGLQDPDDGTCELSPPASPSAAEAPIDTFLATANSEPGLGNESSPIRRRAHGQADLISKGILTHETAETLVQTYLSRLDRFIYGIASKYESARDVRRASPTLLAAMCTVAAFHSPEHKDLFNACNREYRCLVSSALFEKKDDEHIRALCIGSFWLSDASRILSSDAIRRAADSRLHRQFARISEPDSDGTDVEAPHAASSKPRDGVALWYLLFVCDQHLSILHNRDSLLRADVEIVERRDEFMMGGKMVNAEVRLVSQVALLAIMAQIRDAFGFEAVKVLSKPLSVQFSMFSKELDEWFTKFSAIFGPDEHIGDFPKVGLQLHYHFGKLYLGHHVLRGRGKDPIPLHFVPAVSTAYAAATTIFSMILNDPALRDNLIGIPHYFHIMISFAGHFILQACTAHHEQLGVAADDGFSRVSAVLSQLTKVSVLPQHPLSRIATALLRKLSESTIDLGLESALNASPFANLDGQYAAARDQGKALYQGPSTSNEFGLQLEQSMQSDFFFPDFGDFGYLTQDPTMPNFT